MKKILYDNELGEIHIIISHKAKRYSVRVSHGIVKATMPVFGDEKILMGLIWDNKDKIQGFIDQNAAQKDVFDENTTWESSTFKLHIYKTERNNFYMKLEKGVLHIACPHDIDFTEERVQFTIKSLIERALRHEASRILPHRLHQLATSFNFSYTDVKITKSKTRWGSCSGKKSINLSLSLMLLPQHLIDYVLLHELCHTIEMNHSERFWNLMDSLTGGKALTLRQELKSYNIFHI